MKERDMHHYTYMITCLDNLRYYIGRRSSKVAPLDDPYMGSGKALKAAIKRRGADRFIKNVIREFDSSKAAIEHEIYLHNKYEVGTDPRSYNLCSQTSTGFDTTGLKHSEEQRAKISAAMKRIWDDEEYRAKNSEAHSKAVSSPEYRAKKSKASKRMWEDEEFRAKHSEAHLKAMNSPESRAKKSKASKHMWEDEEYRAKMKKARKHMWEDEEYRAKISAAAKRMWEDEEFRAKHLEKLSKAMSSPEYRTKMSKAVKRRWEDEEYRAKMSEERKRRWEDEEFRAKMTEERKRRWQDEEFRAKMTVTCPHCGKTGRKGPMTLHHFNNCKQRSAK